VRSRRKHYLRPGKDLTLDWRPLWTEIKAHVIPVEIGLVQNITRRKSLRTLIKLTYHAYAFFDPNELEQMFAELLPYVCVLRRRTGRRLIMVV
jgi:proteasome activator subunit 4